MFNSVVSKPQKEVIISLTSHPSRFSILHKVINNLLKQSYKPNKILLWVGSEDSRRLPAKLWKYERKGLRIKIIRDLKSYNKIIHCLHTYPKAVVVTCDDDVIYPKNWLRQLVLHHMKNQNTIICHRARKIAFDETGKLKNYTAWPNMKTEEKSLLVFPLGVGGVLYPPGCFDKRIIKDRLFMSLCRHGDDIWLKAMSLLEGTVCKKIHTYDSFFKHFKGSQEVNLQDENLSYRNDEQIQNVFRYFNIVEILQNDCLTE